jgi:Undecaprenyl-phosphate glucose phosphotransferase
MQNGNSRILFIIDLVILYGAFLAVFRHYTGLTLIPLKGSILMGLIVAFWFLISVNSDILKISRLSRTMWVTRSILIAYSVLSTLIIATVAIFGEFSPNDKLILYPLFFSFIAALFIRLVYLTICRQIAKYGYGKKSVLIVGGGASARQVITRLLTTPQLGFHVCGVLAETAPGHPLGQLYLGKFSQLSNVLACHRIDEVIIAKPLSEASVIRGIVDCCETAGLRFSIVADFCSIVPKWTVLDSLGDIPLIAVRNEPLNIFGNRMIKRTFDIVVSLTGLLVLSPLLLVIAAAIKATSPGPVLFRQQRIGNNNAEFTLFKFRSMVVQSCRQSDTTWTTPDDHRVTPVGRILRQSNLDELPQLWNVLVGDMSIVGPRPERAHFVNQFSMQIPNYRIRHLVKSGITGLAQANGWRGNTSIQKRVENDLYYLENWSLWLDFKIIFLTFFSRLAWKNAI